MSGCFRYLAVCTRACGLCLFNSEQLALTFCVLTTRLCPRWPSLPEYRRVDDQLLVSCVPENRRSIFGNFVLLPTGRPVMIGSHHIRCILYMLGKSADSSFVLFLLLLVLSPCFSLCIHCSGADGSMVDRASNAPRSFFGGSLSRSDSMCSSCRTNTKDSFATHT